MRHRGAEPRGDDAVMRPPPSLRCGPLIASLLCFTVVTSNAVLFSRRFMYEEDATPYADVMFSRLPDWSSHASWALAIVVPVYCVCCLAVIATSSVRWTYFRRLFMNAAVAQLIVFACQVGTRMPNPNPDLGTGLTAGRPSAYPMYSVLVALAAAYAVATPTCTTPLQFLVGLAGAAVIVLLLAFHSVYTVDAVTSVATALATFFIAEWNARSAAVVARRPLMWQWYESDFVDQCEYDAQVEARNAAELAPLPSDDSAAGHCGPQSANHELSLVLHINATFDETHKKNRPVWTCAIAVLAAVSIGMLNVASVAVADANRPIGRKPMPDLLFGVAESKLPIDVVDTWLYTGVVIVLIDLILLNPLPLTAMRRSSSIWAVAMLVRVMTVPTTFVADPSPLCSERWHPHSATCGDCIFSGHVISFFAFAHAAAMFRDSVGFNVVAYGWATIGICMMPFTHFHYTRDIVTGFVVYLFARYLLDSLVFTRPDRIARRPLLFKYELDWLVAKERVVFGYPKSNPTEAASEISPLVAHAGDVPIGRMTAHAHAGYTPMEPVDAHAPLSSVGMFNPRWFLRLVRPLHPSRRDCVAQALRSSAVVPVKVDAPATFGYPAHRALW